MCEREIWPPSSPHFNRLDCITLGVYGLRVNFKPHNETENLLTKIKEVMESFKRNTWGRPARGLGQDQRLSSLLMAVSLIKLFLGMFLCHFTFTLLKSDDFQLCYDISKKKN